MPKVNLSDLASLANETTAIALINANNALIEQGFNNTISRDGTSPNTFEDDLDMNNNRIYNLKDPVLSSDAATKSYIDAIALGGSVPIGVQGPVSAVDDDVVTFSGTSGQLIKDSGIASSDLALSSVLASTSNGDGASLISIEDSGTIITATTVEGALVENRTAIDAIEADYLTSSDVGTSVQGFDADTLKADTPDTLTAGFAHTVDNDGTQSGSGTYTPDQDGGNMKRIVNGGAFTLDPPTDDCCLIVQITNNDSAGTITTSGFSGVFGDAFTTTDGDDFICTIIKINGFSSLTVQDVS